MLTPFLTATPVPRPEVDIGADAVDEVDCDGRDCMVLLVTNCVAMFVDGLVIVCDGPDVSVLLVMVSAEEPVAMARFVVVVLDSAAPCGSSYTVSGPFVPFTVFNAVITVAGKLPFILIKENR